VLAASESPEQDQAKGIDKSILAVAAPRRYRSREHLRYVMQQPCLVCGRKPSDPHHLGFTQPRALGRKVSDEFAVPLCRGHHRAAHRTRDERAWWKQAGIDPIKIARRLWKQYVHDICSIVWEILRLRRCKVVIINSAFRSALEGLLVNALRGPGEYKHDVEYKAQALARTWFTDKGAKNQVSELLGRFELDESAIEAEAIR